MEARYWFRPVFSAALKDVKITLRYKSAVVALLVWPVIFPLTFYFMGKGLAGTTGQGLSNFQRLAQTGDYASFLILGNLVWLFININLWMGGLSLQRDRVLGIFDTHWTMPVSKISLVLGATLASIALNFFPLVIGISFYSLIGAFKISTNYFSILFSIVLIMPFLVGFLLVFAALAVRLRQAGMSVYITRAVLSILCGLQFPLAVLPDSVSSIGKHIPLTHFVNMVRGVIIHNHSLYFYRESIIYLIITGVLMLFAGVMIFEMTKRSVKSRGLVAGY
jgi:ABC-2 type transport system permease protein